MTQQILVPFEGENSGVDQLTWGQQEIWLMMQEQRSSLSMGGVFTLPAGSTVQDVAADLGFLMCRHSSLRTRLRFTADGHPQQELAKSGEVTLEIADAGDADPAEFAAALHRRYDEKLFDYVNEWPIRWAVILSRGVPTHLVSVICHLVADGHGVVAMLADLASRDPVTGLAAGPVTAMQPLEQARRQRSPAGRRQNDAAMRHWERLLRMIPARRFTGPADRRQPRFWQVHYDSPASHLAIQAIAARSRASTSTVLLAAFAVGLARITNINPAVVQVVVSNRFRPGFAETVSPVNHTGLCVLDVADITFDEAVARAWRSAMGAYKHAYYDPICREELVIRVGQKRGEQIDIGCFVNDRRMQSPQEPSEEAPEPQELRAALARSALTWGFQQDRPTGRCFLHINNVPDTVRYELCVDTHYVSPADMEACLRGMEAVVVQAALHPAAPTGIRSALLHA